MSFLVELILSPGGRIFIDVFRAENESVEATFFGESQINRLTECRIGK